jgi:hypothetical protein
LVAVVDAVWNVPRLSDAATIAAGSSVTVLVRRRSFSEIGAGDFPFRILIQECPPPDGTSAMPPDELNQRNASKRRNRQNHKDPFLTK